MSATPQDQARHPVMPLARVPVPSLPTGAFDELCRTYESYLAKADKARQEMLSHYAPKSLHAWRVNLRRITATFGPVARALDGESPEPLVALLKALRDASGPCRDLDILLDVTLPAFEADAGDTDPFDSELRHSLQEQHRSIHNAVLAGLPQASLDDAIRMFQAWSEAQRPVSDARLGQVAAAAIERRCQQLHKRAQRLHEGRRRLHHVRNTTKKLRYTIELFQHLYPQHATAHWLEQLARVQTHLGEAHDRLTGRSLCRELLPEPGNRPALKAFRRWARQSAALSAHKAEESLEKLWRLRHFWQTH